MRLLSVARRFGFEDGRLPLLFLTVFFWAVFDGLVTYATPLVMAASGFSNTLIGLLIGSSSVFGALFDLLLCTFSKKASYRQFFLLMLVAALAYPFILGTATHVFGFLFAMAVWAFYWDMYGFGVFNFIAQYVRKEKHAGAFGLLQSSKSLGSTVALLATGILVTGSLFNLFAVAEAMAVLALLFFLLLFLKVRSVRPQTLSHDHRVRGFFFEVDALRRLGRTLWAPLLGTFYYFILEAAFWTLMPLFGQAVDMTAFGGFLLIAFTVPLLLAGILVWKLKKSPFKVHSPYPFIMAGSVLLAAFTFFSKNPYALLFLVSVAAFFFGLALNKVNGIYADLILENADKEREIESLEDFSFNVAYVLGPVAAGLLSDLVGISSTFTLLGILGMGVAVLLHLHASERIRLDAPGS